MLPTWTRGWRPPALSTTLHRKSFASCRGSPWWPRPTPASGDGLVPARAETPLDMRLDLRAEPAEADPVLGEQVQVVGGVGQMHGAAGGMAVATLVIRSSEHTGAAATRGKNRSCGSRS